MLEAIDLSNQHRSAALLRLADTSFARFLRHLLPSSVHTVPLQLLGRFPLLPFFWFYSFLLSPSHHEAERGPACVFERSISAPSGFLDAQVSDLEAALEISQAKVQSMIIKCKYKRSLM